MEMLIYAFLVSLLSSGLIVLSSTFHGHFTNDLDFHSVQKFHVQPVPRVGGLALLAALFIVWLLRDQKMPQDSIVELGWLLPAGLPIIFVGLLEDVTKKIPARLRLYVSLLSAALVYFFVNIYFARIDCALLDNMIVALPVVSFVMTLLVIAGTIHAMNMIDGFNGLMLGVSLTMFAGIALVSHAVDDTLVLDIALICIGAIAGLFVVNFPLGKIFAGDGGAYLIGFLLSTTVLMLVQRNKEVSAWFPCLLISYPLFETLFSIYRKVFLRKIPAMRPDGLHFHMLVYKRITRHQQWMRKWMNNSMTSPYLWLLALIGIVPAILFWNNTILISLSCAFFFVFYLIIYWYLVFFKDQLFFLRFLKFFNINKKEVIEESI